MRPAPEKLTRRQVIDGIGEMTKAKGNVTDSAPAVRTVEPARVEASRHAQMSVSLFAVDRYCDQIRVKATRETLIGSDDKYHYFESECEAHAFIRRRAFEAFLKAEAATVKARLRYNRACRKFPNLIAKVTA